MMIGERIQWHGVNRIESGIVEQEARVLLVSDEKTEEVWSYEARLDDGRYVIVNEKSLIR